MTLGATTDRERLLALIDVHDEAVADFTALLRTLGEEDWQRPTELAGWSVHDIVGHTAHLQTVVARGQEETLEVPEGLAHVRNPMGRYTEAGVIARRDRTPAQLLQEIETSSSVWLETLRADPPGDPAGPARNVPDGLGWSWLTLLTNRSFDVGLHEQDVRRAVGRPGGLDSAGCRHVVGVFARGLGFVLGKRVGAPPGTSVAVELTDSGRRIAATVGSDGRGRRAEPDDVPGAVLRMDTETYLVLSGGRSDVGGQALRIDGDQDLGHRVLAEMVLAP